MGNRKLVREAKEDVINIYQNPDIEDVKRLLAQSNLPTNDLSDLNLDHFYACGQKGDPKGVIGLEAYGSEGLLRSFAVSEDSQGHGYGAALLSKLEQHAKNSGIDNLYLLTNTAELYFQNKGFKKISRQLASDAIRSTKEFSDLCPESATFMHKVIAGR